MTVYIMFIVGNKFVWRGKVRNGPFYLLEIEETVTL